MCVSGFEKRWKDQLSRRVAQNLPKNRAEACSAEVLQDFYVKLKDAIQRNNLEQRPQNIFNCDESGFQTDVGIQKILCRKGSRNPHKVVGSVTKSTYTVLVCCNAIGDYLPLYVNYKGLHLYSTWCQNGPKDSVYNCSPSGWMESLQFANWFENVFIKHTAKLEGPKLLIFDGHNSHLTTALIEMACVNNIELLCLPAHTSHALQPLDVGVFKAVKNSWRNVLKDYYRDTGCKNVDKVAFPSLLNKLVETGCFSRANAIGGFEGSGIYPLNEKKILEKCETSSVLSSTDIIASENDPCTSQAGSRTKLHPEQRDLASTSSLSEQVPLSPKKVLELSLLHALKRQEKTVEPQKRNRVRRKFAESLTSAEVLERMRLENSTRLLKKSRKNSLKKLKKKVESSSESESSLQLDDDSDLDVSECEEQQDDCNNIVPQVKPIDPNQVKVDSWVLVKFSINKLRQTDVYHYVGKVKEILPDREITVKFLRKKEKCFVYPNITDEGIVLINDIVKILPEPTIRRGMHTFNTHFSSIDNEKALVIF